MYLYKSLGGYGGLSRFYLGEDAVQTITEEATVVNSPPVSQPEQIPTVSEPVVISEPPSMPEVISIPTVSTTATPVAPAPSTSTQWENKKGPIDYSGDPLKISSGYTGKTPSKGKYKHKHTYPVSYSTYYEPPVPYPYYYDMPQYPSTPKTIIISRPAVQQQQPSVIPVTLATALVTLALGAILFAR